MRVRLKGINSYTARLADGTRRTYWYAWKGGPRLKGEPGTPEFVASYNEASALKVKTPAGWLLSLLQGYQVSADFRELAERTRQDYAGIIQREIEPKFSDFPLSALTDRRTRGSLWSGAIGSPSSRADRLTTPGPCWRAFSRGRRIAATLPSILASGEGAYTEDRGLIRFGRQTMRRYSSNPRPLTCTCRYCSPFGPGSGG